jgi:hypothetical protein
MIYECPKCTKKFNHKAHYNVHINRKYQCKPILHNSEDIPLFSTINPPEFRLNPLDTIQIPPFTVEDIVRNNIHLDKAIIPPLIKTKKEYKCEYCFKVMSRSDILQKHINLYCKVKKKDDIIKENNQKILAEIIEEMKNEIANLHKAYTKLEEENNDIKTKLTKRGPKKLQNNINISPNNLNVVTDSNNNNNNNITNVTNVTNNIIVPFGKEQLSEIITDAHCNKLLERGISSVTELIKYVHFNKNLPKYHNCYISNARDNHAIIFNGTGWVLVDSIDTIKDLIEKNGGFLECKYEELKPLLTDIAKKQFKRYLDVRDSDELAIRYKEDLKLILYNHGDIVIATRKLQAIKDK